MKIHIPSYDEREEIGTEIIIHPWDTWSMDHTLAMIILPMLKQLKETKHGSPMVDDCDVPEHMRCNDPESESFWEETEPGNVHERWNWVMNEMIWTFEQKNRDWWEEDYIIEQGEIDFDTEADEDDTVELKWKKEHVVDWEGQKAHQERMNNGFRLFGKYYEGLWD